VIFVGKKPTMSYVLAVITQFSEGVKEVHLKARGRSISRAVDVAEVARNRFVTDMKYQIEIGTEKITGEGGGELNVSTIDIVLSK
jgi:DNA-binding protein